MFPKNYDKEPYISVAGYADSAFAGYDTIFSRLQQDIRRLAQPKTVVVLDCYPGIDFKEVTTAFVTGLSPSLTVDAAQTNHCHDFIENFLKRNITDDRVFGVLSCHKMQEFFAADKIDSIRQQIDQVKSGVVFVYGVGATLLYKADILIYADLARWELQLRMRRQEIGNFCADNNAQEMLRKYKRAFFIDWRVADRHKIGLMDSIDYLLDTNVKNQPKMITGEALRAGLKECVKRPFRLVPFFDPGPWGGQWMKEACDLPKNVSNFAWCFDCVPEENSLYLKYGDIRVEIPAINLVLYQPVALLGDKVHARFGAEFPIRFDFLDTMAGGNLSLQVHPLTEYIQQNFGMHYTQDESYYMLDAGDDATVYLGVKTGCDKDQMICDLNKAQEGAEPFPTEKYVNQWPAKKHDHFLIPAGTIHCSGKNSMVLEISSTPYIFTFKLWDWGRLGLDGKPRPIHLEHGKQVIQWHRDTDWTKSNLVNRVEQVAAGDGWIEERTGLHEREFIETRRHWFSKPVSHHSAGGVTVFNLIEGAEAIVESPQGAFAPFTVHYAETFVIPAAVGAYTIRPYGASIGQKVGTIKAFVRV